MVVDAVAILQNCLSEPVSERAGSPPTRRHARPAFHAATADAAPALHVHVRLTIRPRRWRRRTAQRKNKKEANKNTALFSLLSDKTVMVLLSLSRIRSEAAAHRR